MKQNDFFKFGLSIICAAVLSACGSGGSSSSPSTGSTTTVQQPGGSGGEAGKEEKKDETKKDETKKDDQAATKVDTAVDDVVLKTTPNTDDVKNSFVGYKHVTKKDSGFIINTPSNTNGADVPAALYVQNPFPSLDTIVVAEPENASSQDPRGYLEDFDFRGSKDANAQTSGEFTLKHIYLETPAERTGTKGGDPRTPSLTKTETQGTEKGKAFVYQDGRVNYTTNYAGEVYNVKGEGVDMSLPTNTQRTEEVLKGSVAEVYGYRTFAKGGMDDLNKQEKKDFVDEVQANLPLATNAENAQLKNVQYGRVTSALSDHTQADFKDGKKLGTIPTFVVSFGKYGDDKSENHYFYRGINNVGKEALAKLSGVYDYYGHAVSYGLDDNFVNNKDINIPTAIGGTLGLISGNHVHAKVDFGEKKVDGSIFNSWYVGSESDPKMKVQPSTLVSFGGTLADNGNIAGNSVYLKNNTTGTFGATLFGEKAEEMGGVVASHDKTEGNRWGAVFGAIREKDKAVAPGLPANGQLQNGTGANAGGAGNGRQ